jgi:preprotein translocase subunit SecF
MLGYSIDTDVLLTTKVLKRKEGRVFERIKSSFITGVTITLTTLTASIFAILITNSAIIREMFIILVIGLSTDLISTYIMNAGILRWYLKNED